MLSILTVSLEYRPSNPTQIVSQPSLKALTSPDTAITFRFMEALCNAEESAGLQEL
jgi:hypothetical protein